MKYQTVKAVAAPTKGRIEMRRIIGTRVNGRMLTPSGLTFPEMQIIWPILGLIKQLLGSNSQVLWAADLEWPT